MGARGPAPTPTAILNLRGSWRAKRNQHEPRPRAKRPKCPPWLDSEAKREWRRLAPELFRLGLLTCVDGDSFACYCQAWAEFKWATETLTREGRILTAEKTGYQQPHPAVAMQRSAGKALQAFGALFGLSPSARARLQVEPPAPATADPLDEFLDSIGNGN